jgi:hypothetical protein
MSSTKEIVVTESRSIIGFETTGNAAWPAWDRFITLQGQKAYHIGNICGTCAFFFERMEGANHDINVESLREDLNAGLSDLNCGVVDDIKAILPNGNYIAVFSEIHPNLCVPGDKRDYFSHEQVTLWGIDGFWGLPHFPKTKYYRLRTCRRNDAGLFEFLIPIFSDTSLSQPRIDDYKSILAQGARPTLVSLGVLDVKEPAVWNGAPDITSHWCLAHYLLDGHHKAHAAALSQKPITMLSFLAIDEGISSREQIDRMLHEYFCAPAGSGLARETTLPEVPTLP